MATWWNSSYIIRKQLFLENPSQTAVSTSSPLYAVIDTTKLISLNKVRSDFEDVEVLYYDDSIATPSWTLLGRSIDYSAEDGTITISFNAVKDIEIADDNYYIYYCNARLLNQETRPTYISNVFSTVATVNSGGIMLTKPTEDWDGGVSQSVNARAAFNFYGKFVRVVFQGRKDGGFMEYVSKPSETPILIDTYSPDDSEISHETNFSTVEKQLIRMRVTDNKNPSASDSVVELKRIEYSKYTQVELGAEEIYPVSDGIRTTVGS